MRCHIVETVRKWKPLIHCITNYVTANDVANMILAAGARPVMAESSLEMEEMAEISQGLVLNMGMLSEQKLEAMILAGKRAAHLGHPVILDPVGVGASSFRAKAVQKILGEVPCTVIRGNYSEIQKAAELTGIETKEQEEGGKDYGRLSAFNEKTGAVIVVTGETDLVADSGQIYSIHNGVPMMSSITGTGCMLDGVIAAYAAAWTAEHDEQTLLEAVALSVAALGLCGEWAYKKVWERAEGTGSFRTYLLDFMSRLDSKQLMGGKKIEIQTIISDSICSD